MYNYIAKPKDQNSGKPLQKIQIDIISIPGDFFQKPLRLRAKALLPSLFVCTTETFREPMNRFQGIDSASLCSLAGQYDNPTPSRFLAPIDCSKVPAHLYARPPPMISPVGEKT